MDDDQGSSQGQDTISLRSLGTIVYGNGSNRKCKVTIVLARLDDDGIVACWSKVPRYGGTVTDIIQIVLSKVPQVSDYTVYCLATSTLSLTNARSPG